MIEPLHLLLVAPPAESDAQPAAAVLRRAGFDPRPLRVATAEGLGAALVRRRWDAVVIEASGTPLHPLDALAWVRRKQPHVPVFVVGAAAEDAVALIEAGVTDLFGPADLTRLGAALAKARLAGGAQPSSPNEAFYDLAAHMPIGMYRSTADGRILYANPALARILGRESVEDLLGIDVRHDLAYPRAAFEERMGSTGAVAALEVSWPHPDGRTVHTREHTRAVRDASGDLLYYEGTMEDVTDERQTLLRERRRAGQLEAIVHYCGTLDRAAAEADLHRATVEATASVLEARGAVLFQEVKGGFQVAAGSAGLPAEALRVCEEHLAPHLWQEAERSPQGGSEAINCPYLAAAGLPAAVPFLLLHRGRIVGALVALFGEGGGLAEGDASLGEALAWHAASALARWDAERAVRASEATLRSIASATGHVLYRRRFSSATYDYISDSVLPLTGYTAEEVNAGGGLLPLLLETEVTSGAGLPEGAPSPTGEPYLALHRLRTCQGPLRWVEDRAYPWVDEEGGVIGLVGVLEDVTERQRRVAEEQEGARRLLEQQRALLDLSVLDVDADEFVSHVTEAAARLTESARVSVWTLADEGEAEEPVLACRDLYLLEEGRHASLAPIRLEDLGHGRAALREHRVYNNDDLAATDIGSPFLDAYYAEHGIRAVLAATIRQRGQVVGFVGIEHVGSPRAWTAAERELARALADLVALAEERTHRGRAEAALRASERRYRAVSEMTSDYAFAVRYGADGRNRLEWSTRAFERITGYDPEAFRSPEELVRRVVHPEDLPRMREAEERLRRGEDVDLVLRVVTTEGLARWVHHRATPLLAPDGALRTVFATGQDISERIRFEEELQAARDRAEAARSAAETAQAEAEAMAREKGDLLANMSHEIRTPLTGIIGFAEVLEEEVGVEHRDFAALIATSGRRLLETLNSVLDLARLESGRLACEPVPLDAAVEVQQVVGLLHPMAEAKGIDLHIEAEGGIPAVLDRGCLSRVLTNLAGNAIKFTDEGHVAVRVHAAAGELLLCVSDTGVGMDADFLPHLFEEFRQEAGDPGRREGGSGLGLAITRRLVELMGGGISVESAKGQGTTFTVRLPLAPPSDDLPFTSLFDSDEEAPPPLASLPYTVTPLLVEDLAEEADQRGLGWVEVEEWTGDGAPTAPASPPASADTAAPEADPIRMLVVEDNDETRHLMERVLAPHFAVESVRDARGALERMSLHAFDVLVLDINLGGKQTGADVLRIARTLPGYEAVPAVAVTAYALPGDDEQLLRAGFSAYVSKPFAVHALLDALRDAGVLSRG